MSVSRDPQMLTIAEAAAEVGVSWHTMQRVIAKGDLPCRRLGKAVRISRYKLLEYMHGRDFALEIARQEAAAVPGSALITILDNPAPPPRA